MSAAPSLDATIGALEIGTVISLSLFGACTVQAYVYYRNFPDDNRVVKALVASIWTLELVHTILVTHALYIITVKNYGHPEILLTPPKSLFVSVFFSGFITPLCQAFFAQRVHAVSRKLWIALICYAVLFVRFLAIMSLSGLGVNTPNIALFETHNRWLILVVLITGAVADVLIAGSLCFFLLKKRSSLFAHTARTIDRLIALTLETSLLTCLTTLAMLILFLTMTNFVWLGIFVVTSRIFSNCFLASLNARVDLRERNRSDVLEFSDRSQHTGIAFPAQSSSFTDTARQHLSPSGFRHPELAIHVMKEAAEFGDFKPGAISV
ncbi:hypothetical protein PLICRDRAFT_411716 [Plicaturopsis crispa FD-325 SS-3]|nr:hypothetical protein PLICRDRAFT_411716 [Plicaturopsis crispa FD-325 SS-3]